MKEKVDFLIQKIRERKAFLSVFAMAFVLTALTPAVCHAEGASGGNISADMTSSLTTAFNAVKTDVLSIITTALPPALAIMGVIIAVMVGIRFFKRAAK